MFNRRPFLQSTTFLLCWLSLLLGAAHAQNVTGSIVGTLNDATGASVSGATVMVTNHSTGEKRSVTTTDSGEYQLLSLPTGQYKLDVEGAGFKHYTRDPIEVRVDESARVNVSLDIGSVNESVVVTSQAPIIQSETANLGQTVQGKAVQDIPLNGRNVLALVGLVPGVVPQGSSGGNLTGQNVFAAGNYQIGGGAANQSSTLYDGAPVNINYGNITALVPDQDAVQEFRVQTNNNTAEFGDYTGGVINIASKSGSNGIHGTAYEFDRNTVFNAIPYFNRHNPMNILPKNPYNLNQFGGNIGFPIIRDKLFGFFDYQGYRQRQGKTYNYTVPTLKMRQGDFSELSTPIYDPCGGTVSGGQACPGYTGPRTPFAGNIIPRSRWSPVATKILNYPYWAAPTTGGVLNNFLKVAGAGGNNDQYTGRVDFSLSQKQRLFGRYTQWNSMNIGAQPYGNGLIGGDPISPEAFKTRQLVFGDTYIFSPTLIGDLRLSWLRWTYIRTPGTLGYDETQLGLPSYFGNISTFNKLPGSTTFPTITLANPTVNQVNTGYLFGTDNSYVIAPSVTKTIRTHTIKAGADLRRLEQQYFQNNNPGGTFAFDPNMTASADSGATSVTSTNAVASGSPVASFLLGYMVNQANTASSIQVGPPTYNALYYQGFFVQDNWVITPKLTLNYGLRYEIPGVYRERHELMTTFNASEVNPVLGAISVNGRPVLGAYDLVGTPQHPALGLRNEHFNNFSPRLGLAYRWNDQTVIRAGWGKFTIPGNLQFPESPAGSQLANFSNTPVTTLDNGVTPNTTLDNPVPQGLIPAPGRSAAYQQALLGAGGNAVLQDEPLGQTYQWNLAVQRQLPAGIALEAAYAGSHGSNLPVSIGTNQVSEATLAQAAGDPACNTGSAPSSTCFLTKTVVNPFQRSLFTAGQQQYANISSVQLNRPFPQYGNISNVGHYAGTSNYNALLAKVEKRFNQGGVLLGSYSFSKYMTNAESLTSWLEVAGAAGFQGHKQSQWRVLAVRI